MDELAELRAENEQLRKDIRSIGEQRTSLGDELVATRVQLAKLRRESRRWLTEIDQLTGRIEQTLTEPPVTAKARLETIKARALMAIQAVPRRSGTPEWDKAASVAQAVGFDMGLAAASDAVSTTLRVVIEP